SQIGIDDFRRSSGSNRPRDGCRSALPVIAFRRCCRLRWRALYTDDFVDLVASGFMIPPPQFPDEDGKNTVIKLMIDAGKACAAYHDEHVRNLASKRIQVDEIWSFTYAKEKNVATAKAAPEGAGDTWTWTAIDADSKFIIAWFV